MSCRILYHHRIRADDGQAVHVRELIRALRAAGHEVREFALVPKAERTPVAAGGSSRWSKVRLPRTAIELLEIGYGRQGGRSLAMAGAEFRPDFVYERHALHCDAGLRAARQLGVPLLLEVNSPLCDEMERLGKLRFPRRARRTQQRVLAGADIVFAVTAVLRDILIAAGARPDRTLVVGNGAVPERYGPSARAAGAALRARLNIPADRFVLGFIGYMRDWHRLDLAVEVLARAHLAAVHLVLVGSGPALPSVLARALSLGVADRVHPVGVAAPDDLPGHVCAFDAALIPAINHYASPLKLFDSLAAGVPTLAPRQPNLEETLDDGTSGILFEPGNADALDRALAPLVADRDRARAIGAAGREVLLRNDWTWAGNARRVVAAYRALRAGEPLR